MLFSSHFGISRTHDDDWFDPVLSSDTALFVDPFLIFKEPTDSYWSDGHALLIGHFNKCFKLIAEGNCNPNSLAYKKAVSLLCFPEPREFCLGYTLRGTSGSGAGNIYARSIASAISAAIERGKISLKHFEELGIFNKGIGRDRISDFTCNIIKNKIVEYTLSIADRHNLPKSSHIIHSAFLEERRLRWSTGKFQLPTNPFNDSPILLIPQRFLRDLPQINSRNWWEWYENEQLRVDLSYEVLGSVDKKTIVDIARSNPNLVQKYIDIKEKENPDPYDLNKDKNGTWIWVQETRRYASQNEIQITPASDHHSFDIFIESVLKQFRHFVEHAGGWRLLWNDDKKEKPESAAQLLLRGIAENYCRAANIVIDREVELGRGSVDFKFSSGYQNRALLEVKKVHNGKFWNGLEKQMTSYLRSDNCSKGWFLAIIYRSSPSSLNRVKDIPKELERIQAQHPNLQLRYFVVDARPKLSASNL